MSIAQKLMSGGWLDFTWDLSYAYYSGVSYSVSGQTSDPTGVFFKPDGLKLYVARTDFDAVLEYNLSIAWDLSTASYSQNFSASSDPHGLYFKPDGLKMYLMRLGADEVSEYDLSTAWDISTATFNQSFSVAAQDSLPVGLTFKPDGTKMYVTGLTLDYVNEYDLSTAWDISTATYTQRFRVLNEGSSPYGVSFKDDGTSMYVLNTAYVDEYTLGAAWDVSTATYVQNFGVFAQDTDVRGLYFNPDGTQMFVSGVNTDRIYTYTLGPQ